MSAVKNPDAAATRKQTFYIFTLSGEDVRPLNLTRQQASDKIATLLAQKGREAPAVSSADLPKSAEAKTDFSRILRLATIAANKAGDEWIANARPLFRVVQRANPLDKNSPVVKDYGTMLDVCGIVYLELTDKRTRFGKWIVNKSSDNSYASKYVPIPHKYANRQEMGLGEACAMAALKVLRDNGIDSVRMYSRID